MIFFFCSHLYFYTWIIAYVIILNSLCMCMCVCVCMYKYTYIQGECTRKLMMDWNFQRAVKLSAVIFSIIFNFRFISFFFLNTIGRYKVIILYYLFTSWGKEDASYFLQLYDNDDDHEAIYIWDSEFITGKCKNFHFYQVPSLIYGVHNIIHFFSFQVNHHHISFFFFPSPKVIQILLKIKEKKK